MRICGDELERRARIEIPRSSPALGQIFSKFLRA